MLTCRPAQPVFTCQRLQQKHGDLPRTSCSIQLHGPLDRPACPPRLPYKVLAASQTTLVTGLAAATGLGLLAAGTAAAADLDIHYHVQVILDTGAAVVPGVLGDSPFREGVVEGFLLILFSELGDKTFFIALLLALRQNKSLVFAGTFGALAIMTVISVGLGEAIHKLDTLLPESQLPLDDLAAVALLTFFGIKTLADARNADEKASDEKAEAEETVAELGTGAAAGLVLSTFTLVFAAEWGDKSFLATIALAASSSPIGVIIGAVAGHGLATAIAVVGGSWLGKRVSEQAVQYLGGSLFLVFAAATLADLYREM